MHDVEQYPEAATYAKRAFEAGFPTDSGVILTQTADSIVEFCIEGMKTSCKDVTDECHQLYVAAALYGLAGLIQEDPQVVFQDHVMDCSLKLLTSKGCIIRKAAYYLIMTFSRFKPQVISSDATNLKQIATAILGILVEKEPCNHTNMWNAMLYSMKAWPFLWTALKNPKQTVFPKVWSMFRHGLYGSASYLSVSPFFMLLPDDLLDNEFCVLFLKELWKGTQSSMSLGSEQLLIQCWTESASLMLKKVDSKPILTALESNLIDVIVRSRFTKARDVEFCIVEFLKVIQRTESDEFWTSMAAHLAQCEQTENVAMFLVHTLKITCNDQVQRLCMDILLESLDGQEDKARLAIQLLNTAEFQPSMSIEQLFSTYLKPLLGPSAQPHVFSLCGSLLARSSTTDLFTQALNDHPNDYSFACHWISHVIKTEDRYFDTLWNDLMDRAAFYSDESSSFVPSEAQVEFVRLSTPILSVSTLTQVVNRLITLLDTSTSHVLLPTILSSDLVARMDQLPSLKIDFFRALMIHVCVSSEFHALWTTECIPRLMEQEKEPLVQSIVAVLNTNEVLTPAQWAQLCHSTIQLHDASVLKDLLLLQVDMWTHQQSVLRLDRALNSVGELYHLDPTFVVEYFNTTCSSECLWRICCTDLLFAYARVAIDTLTTSTWSGTSIASCLHEHMILRDLIETIEKRDMAQQVLPLIMDAISYNDLILEIIALDQNLEPTTVIDGDCCPPGFLEAVALMLFTTKDVTLSFEDATLLPINVLPYFRTIGYRMIESRDVVWENLQQSCDFSEMERLIQLLALCCDDTTPNTFYPRLLAYLAFNILENPSIPDARVSGNTMGAILDVLELVEVDEQTAPVLKRVITACLRTCGEVASLEQDDLATLFHIRFELLRFYESNPTYDMTRVAYVSLLDIIAFSVAQPWTMDDPLILSRVNRIVLQVNVLRPLVLRVFPQLYQTHPMDLTLGATSSAPHLLYEALAMDRSTPEEQSVIRQTLYDAHESILQQLELEEESDASDDEAVELNMAQVLLPSALRELLEHSNCSTPVWPVFLDFVKITCSIFSSSPQSRMALATFVKTQGLLNKFLPPLFELLPLTEDTIYQTIKWFPTLTRCWWTDDCSRKLSVRVSQYVEEKVAPLLIVEEIQGLAETTWETDEMSVKGSRVSREITSTYMKDDCALEIVIRIPTIYPLRPVEVECSQRMGISEERWRRWVLQIIKTTSTQDGMILDAVKLWKRNVDREFDGVEPCPICYSILNPKTFGLPKLACPTCKNKYHNSCLYKWFNQSGKNKCPVCQQPVS